MIVNVRNLDKAFNSVHRNEANLNDENMKDPVSKTLEAINKMCPDISSEVIQLFTKIKYHAKVRALNEQTNIDKLEIFKRKAAERGENPKKMKNMRDFIKDGHFYK